MLVVMYAQASSEDVDRVCRTIEDLGLEPRPMPGEGRTAVGLMGGAHGVDPGRFRGLPGVQEVIRVSAPYKQVSREWKPDDTVITLSNGVEVGGKALVVFGGPCAVENEQSLLETAEIVAKAGGVALRGGAFKPRTSPYSFQGLGEEGLKIMAKARDRYGLAIVTEALDESGAVIVAQYADIVQVGARNMQNFALLRRVGKLGKPVMLKRGMSATIKEWLLAAEYILNEGNANVILCERGIRSFDSSTRNVMDVAAIAMVKELTHLPVIADPSHSTGRRSLVTPVARASVAGGADGLIVETHPNPHEALSDGEQSLHPEEFSEMMRQVGGIAEILGRPLARLKQGRVR